MGPFSLRRARRRTCVEVALSLGVLVLLPEEVLVLEAEPHLGARPEGSADLRSGLASDLLLAGDDLGDELRRAVEDGGELSLSPTTSLELVGEELPRGERLG